MGNVGGGSPWPPAETVDEGSQLWVLGTVVGGSLPQLQGTAGDAGSPEWNPDLAEGEGQSPQKDEIVVVVGSLAWSQGIVDEGSPPQPHVTDVAGRGPNKY